MISVIIEMTTKDFKKLDLKVITFPKVENKESKGSFIVDSKALEKYLAKEEELEKACVKLNITFP